MEKYRKIIQNVGGPAYMAYINAFQVRFPRQKKNNAMHYACIGCGK